MHDGDILGLARARRDDGSPSGALASVQRRLGFSHGAGLVGFDQHGVAGAGSGRVLHARGIGHQEIVTDDLHILARGRGEFFHAFGVVFGDRILDRDDRVALQPSEQQLAQAVAVQLAAVQAEPVAARTAEFRGGDVERDADVFAGTIAGTLDGAH